MNPHDGIPIYESIQEDELTRITFTPFRKNPPDNKYYGSMFLCKIDPPEIEGSDEHQSLMWTPIGFCWYNNSGESNYGHSAELSYVNNVVGYALIE